MKTNDAYISDQSQRELAAGVLKQAAQDLERFSGRTSRVERELYHDAYSWVMSDDFSWPFSFQNVCGLLNRAPDDLRQELIGDLSFGCFGRCSRRCSRGLRRFLGSLTQRFTTEHNLSTAMPARLVQTSH
jgi:hypothetical protein